MSKKTPDGDFPRKPKTELGRLALEARKARREAGLPFLTREQIDVLLGRADEPQD